MAKHKYYKYNTVTGEVVEEYLESAEDTLILMQNPLVEIEQDYQNEEILTVQDALNYILMGEFVSLIERKSAVNGLGKYFGDQIFRKRLNKEDVIDRYPQLKLDIDSRLKYLESEGGV